tara:strand:- start:1752 stop:1961 length:210 start_codon:yes stop_codon:yes gene_type:complete
MRGYLDECDIGDCFVDPYDIAVPAGVSKARHYDDTLLRRRLTDLQEDLEEQELDLWSDGATIDGIDHPF